MVERKSKSWKTEAIKKDREIELLKEQLATLKEKQAAVKPQSSQLADEAQKNIENKEKQLEEKQEEKKELENANSSEMPSTQASEQNLKPKGENGADTEPPQTSNSPENANKAPESKDIEVDDAEPSPDDFKHQCGECGSLFNEFEDSTKCPKCKTDWAEELANE